MTDIKKAVSDAKASLDKIKVKKEKHGEGKDARETSKLEKPEELEGALGEAKQALDYYVLQVNQQRLPDADISKAKYSIDKIALVRGDAENVEAAVKDAKAKLDELAKHGEETKKK